jgi:hypothetical protein
MKEANLAREDICAERREKKGDEGQSHTTGLFAAAKSFWLHFTTPKFHFSYAPAETRVHQRLSFPPSQGPMLIPYHSNRLLPLVVDDSASSFYLRNVLLSLTIGNNVLVKYHPYPYILHNFPHTSLRLRKATVRCNIYITIADLWTGTITLSNNPLSSSNSERVLMMNEIIMITIAQCSKQGQIKYWWRETWQLWLLNDQFFDWNTWNVSFY